MDYREQPLLRTDSYAKIFLYNTHETVACVPRHTIRMSEKVKPALLEQAVGQALLRFPHMMLAIEPTETSFRYVHNVRPPKVLPFDGARTRYTIGSADTGGYLFLVGYQDDTITLEYQHSVSDGRGFEEFIKTVLFEYLRLDGKPVANDGTVRGMDTRYSPEESADGYRQLADREYSSEGIWKKPKAAHAWELTGLGDGPEIVSEVTFPFAALHTYAKKIGVSPLSIVAPLFMRAFDRKFGGGDEPVIAQIPVDLRPLLPTATTRYFICFIDLPYLPEYRGLPLDEVFRRTRAFLKTQMEPEQLMFRAKAASDRCRALHEADMPLVEKCAAGQKLCRDFVLEDSFLITNVGEFKLPESCLPYVLDYGAVLPTATQPFALLVSSYNGQMKLSVAQRDHDLDVVSELARGLHEIGVHTKMRSYPFAVTRYDGMPYTP
ncbi:hypothetical protein [Agathobaculum sp.]|uniref:hypothetical protein n=1 Tax=Agathobaculum sp. TaxID=2048138 RepID=UPI002A81A4ED|nr:hypothetical protein [Agathobaculum sp.]MCI5704039.1 hypothetical protein [Pseudoflavonifractor sp.]MDY3618561.1 hypothetical protein [Agathobaculum sp.]